MQDLFQNYVGDLNKLREAFHGELAATAEELSKAMGNYARRSEAALASFMDKVATRGVELEAAAAARLNQFQGLPANGGLPDVDTGGLSHPLANPEVGRIATAAERAVAESLDFESDADRKPPLGRPMTLVRSEPVKSEPAA
jgi:hypothetical protein